MLGRLKSWSDWKIALLVSAGLRIFYTALAALFSVFGHPDPGLIHSNAFTGHLPPSGTLYYVLLGIWQRFDTLWYLHIAQHGYDRPEAVVFYPLYPALIRILGLAFGAIGSALIISTISSFIVFWGFLEILKSQSPDASRGRGLALFAVWPASFILFAGYTEALTIALVLWCMLFARSERWLAAALLGFAAGLTRSAGSLLIFPLAILAWKSRRRSRCWIVLAPIGTLTYWAWLRVTGRPSVVSSYRIWDTAVVAPWTTLWRVLTFLAHRPDTLVLINLAVLTLFAVTGSFARRRAEDRTFSGLIILQILMRSLAPPLSGAFRYVLPIYPAFLTMAEWAEGMKRTHFVFLCVVLFAFNLVWMWEFLNWSLVL